MGLEVVVVERPTINDKPGHPAVLEALDQFRTRLDAPSEALQEIPAGGSYGALELYIAILGTNDHFYTIFVASLVFPGDGSGQVASQFQRLAEDYLRISALPSGRQPRS